MAQHFGGCFSVATALLLTVWAAASTAAPFTPSDPAQVLERLPASGRDDEWAKLRELRRTLARQPDNLLLATRVATLYIDRGRRRADPRYYGYAQAALAPWWSTPEPPLPVLLLRATVRQHDHEFEAALDDLGLVLRRDGDNAQAWLARAVILQVRGDYAAAKQSCLEVLRLATPLVAVTCVATVDALDGAAPAAYTMLQGALARSAAADRQAHLWALTAAGEIAARLGHTLAAREHFRSALELSPDDDYLLGAYADFLLDQGEADAVISMLAGRTASDALLLRLAEAEKRIGAAALPAHVAMLGQRFEAARRRGSAVHRREEGRFALHVLGEPQRALALARDNWAVQKEPADTRLLLEAAVAAADRPAAAPAVEFTQRHHQDDLALQALIAPLRGPT